MVVPLVCALISTALTLPETGAWTGALVAAMLDMRIKKSIPAIIKDFTDQEMMEIALELA